MASPRRSYNGLTNVIAGVMFAAFSVIFIVFIHTVDEPTVGVILDKTEKEYCCSPCELVIEVESGDQRGETINRTGERSSSLCDRAAGERIEFVDETSGGMPNAITETTQDVPPAFYATASLFFTIGIFISAFGVRTLLKSRKNEEKVS